MATLAYADGTRTIVATPHVRDDHRYDLTSIDRRVAALNAELERQSIAVGVIAGAEVALSKLPDLSDEMLRRLCIGDGSYLLVESPYTDATDLLESDVFNVQVRGFLPILAHPERSPTFMRRPELLKGLVSRGALCSVTAGSMSGHFGQTIQRFTRWLFEMGLVHNVASDAHDTQRRPPVLRRGFRRLGEEMSGLTDQLPWYTGAAAEAIVQGHPLPRRPERTRPRSRSRVRRMWDALVATDEG